jgi:hypothetical protein
MLAEASNRPRYYFPIVAGSVKPRIGILLCAIGGEEPFSLAGDRRSGLFACAAQAFLTRSMFRLNEGRIDEAWKDLLACHRLARLAGQGPLLSGVATAACVDELACKGEQVLAGCGKLTAAQIRKMRAELANLPPLAKMADKLDIGERFVHLDTVTTIASRWPISARGLFGECTAPDANALYNVLVGQEIDWNVALRLGNSWCDRILAAFHKPTYAERVKAMAELDVELQKMAKSVRDVKSLGLSPSGTPLAPMSEWMGQTITTTVSPAFVPARKIEDRAMMQRELTPLALALAEYQAEYGRYPEKLSDLVPKYLKEVPKDIFNNDAALHYAPQGDGYLLYSVGLNGKDDGGKGEDDRKNGEDWDDLAVRMSAARP